MLEDKAQSAMAEFSALLPLIVSNALGALSAVLILLIGLWLSGRAGQLVVTMMRRTPHVDPMLPKKLCSIGSYVVLTLKVVAWV